MVASDGDRVLRFEFLPRQDPEQGPSLNEWRLSVAPKPLSTPTGLPTETEFTTSAPVPPIADPVSVDYTTPTLVEHTLPSLDPTTPNGAVEVKLTQKQRQAQRQWEWNTARQELGKGVSSAVL